jgi:hypothetical protein
MPPQPSATANTAVSSSIEITAVASSFGVDLVGERCENTDAIQQCREREVTSPHSCWNKKWFSADTGIHNFSMGLGQRNVGVCEDSAIGTWYIRMLSSYNPVEL